MPCNIELFQKYLKKENKIEALRPERDLDTSDDLRETMPRTWPFFVVRCAMPCLSVAQTLQHNVGGDGEEECSARGAVSVETNEGRP